MYISYNSIERSDITGPEGAAGCVECRALPCLGFCQCVMHPAAATSSFLCQHHKTQVPSLLNLVNPETSDPSISASSLLPFPCLRECRVLTLHDVFCRRIARFQNPYEPFPLSDTCTHYILYTDVRHVVTSPPAVGALSLTHRSSIYVHEYV